MRFIIDRIEGELAAAELEDGSIVSVPLCALPPETREGDVIAVSVDAEETARRRENAAGRLERLFGRNK